MKDSTTRVRRYISNVLTAVFWIVVWQVFALIVDQQLFLASPISVIVTLAALVTQSAFYAAVVNTFLHITTGFLCAFLIGIGFAALSAKVRVIKKLLLPLMTMINSTPVASFTILALILVGSKHISALMAFIMVMPIIYTNTLSGIQQIKKPMFEAAEIFGMPRAERLRYIYLPETLPYVLSSSSVGLGISWKAGVAAEVIGIASKTIGGKLYDAKNLLNTSELFAYTLVIILISLAFEKLFVALLKRSVQSVLD